MKIGNVCTILAFVMFALGVVSCAKKKPAEERPVTTQPQIIKDTTSIKPEINQSPKRTLQESQLQTIYFDFDRYNLRSDAKANLDANYALLRDFPDVIVKIEGHCDERGTVEYNIALGDRRARETRDYLISLGIAPNRLSIISYGKERPAVIGSNEQAWAKNRRCEFRVISQ
jgi:peptidoglycan-associated lipoprotein